MSSTSPTVQVVLEYTVTVKSSGAPVPNQTVTFSYEAQGATSPTQAGTATTDSNGNASITITIPAGSYTFSGSSHDPSGVYADSSASVGPVPIQVPTSGKLVVVSVS
jgi:hypothetical protein